MEERSPTNEQAFNQAEDEEIGVSLVTPDNIRKLQRKLYIKANEEPEFRFYTLYDKVYREDILKHAYRCARHNGGSPGVDRVSFEDIESQGVDEWLKGLEEQLRQKTYRPDPVRRVRIPKPDGGERPLGIPTIKDRVAQMAAKMVLEPIFEADFEDCAHGYRPERSAQDAVEEVHEAITEGYTEVVDADLSSYFDTIPHARLMKAVARRVSDKHMLRLVKMWLKAPVEDEDDDGNRRREGGRKTTEGTPQGGVISPLLANLYMNRFLKFWAEQQMDQKLDAHIVNYADDFVILTRGRAEEALGWTRAVMEAIGLTLNRQKTCIRDAKRESFDFLGYTFGPEYWRPTGRRYLAAKPSEKAVKRLKGSVRRWLKGNPLPWEMIVERLNQKLAGWANYFCYGTRHLAYKAIDHYVYEAVVSLLSQRHKMRTRGKRQLPEALVFGRLGVRQLYKNRRKGNF